MLKYIILDVDGTLTDGGIYYDSRGNELKKFSSKDGTGILCALAANIQIIILTGRECLATTKRMKELGIQYIYQNVKDKAEWVRQWMNENSIKPAEVGYIGDDVNDIGPMEMCGFVGCPSDAAVEVKQIADYISLISGGYGAVKDIIEHYLKEHDLWKFAIKRCYGIEIQP